MTEAVGFTAAAWWFLGATVVVAIGFAIGGAIGVFRVMKPLQKRLDGYSDLPMVRAMAQTQARLEGVQGQLEQVNILVLRSKLALETIQTGMLGLLETGLRVQRAIGAAFGLIKWAGGLLGFVPTRR
jgi:hypothetical protein